MRWPSEMHACNDSVAVTVAKEVAVDLRRKHDAADIAKPRELRGLD